MTIASGAASTRLRNRPSSRSRSVTSRTIADAATTVPSPEQTGETLTDAGNRVPSRCTPTSSKTGTGLPSTTWASAWRFIWWPSLTVSSEVSPPMTSFARQPNIRSAPPFQ
jgi:hypothetical protein